MYFLKLEEGKVIANTDLGDLELLPMQLVEPNKVGEYINVLEMANKSFLYGNVTQTENKHQATF